MALVWFLVLSELALADRGNSQNRGQPTRSPNRDLLSARAVSAQTGKPLLCTARLQTLDVLPTSTRDRPQAVGSTR